MNRTLLLAVLLPSAASAHAAGPARGSWSVGGGEVRAELQLSASELAASLPALAADASGALDAKELSGSADALADAFVAGTTVTSGGERCDGALRSAAPVENDG